LLKRYYKKNPQEMITLTEIITLALLGLIFVGMILLYFRKDSEAAWAEESPPLDLRPEASFVMAEARKIPSP